MASPTPSWETLQARYEAAEDAFWDKAWDATECDLMRPRDLFPVSWRQAGWIWGTAAIGALSFIGLLIMGPVA